MTPPSQQQQPDLKQRTARTIKWNVVDKVATQVLYAATGIVLMRELSREAFGLVGAVLVVQAFALMFVDSGFASALIQRKDPDNRDYSTVFWFNICISVLIYTLLWFAAPLIADWFHDDRLVTLSRAMFLTVLLSALGIVQTNRMVKRMNVRPVTVANVAGLALGSAVGIYLAFTRGDAWALVWQSVVTTGAKSLLLWGMVRWIPAPVFSWSRLRSFFKVGAGVMAGAFLNNVFQNIYGIFIGNRVGMLSLAYYSQADKWSKMGTASLSGVLTSSFLPTLSEVQDSPERLIRATRKMNRFTAYLLFFGFGWLIAAATPVFHLLFGEKWDAAIILFQLLLVRGIFTVLTSLYSNYILAMGRSRLLVVAELLRDAAALAALVACFPVLALSTPARPTYGLELMLYGQIAASALMWLLTLIAAAKVTGSGILGYITDAGVYLLTAAPAVAAAVAVQALVSSPFMAIAAGGIAAAAVYLAVNAMLGSALQREVLALVFKR